jgi:hypothetical protein
MSVRFFIYRKALVGGGSDSRKNSGEKKTDSGVSIFFPKILGRGTFFFLFKTHRKNVTIFSM